jgi:hypothetical protein
MSADIGSLDILSILNHDKRTFGVLLALVENPAAVPKIVAQLSTAGGDLGEGVLVHYQNAKAEIATVP